MLWKEENEYGKFSSKHWGQILKAVKPVKSFVKTTKVKILKEIVVNAIKIYNRIVAILVRRKRAKGQESNGMPLAEDEGSRPRPGQPLRRPRRRDRGRRGQPPQGTGSHCLGPRRRRRRRDRGRRGQPPQGTGSHCLGFFNFQFIEFSALSNFQFFKC